MNFKNTVIFGDSYSTFDGYIPKGYAAYYPADHTGVEGVEQTWWHILIKETGSALILNDSWSGSTIGHTGYDREDCSKTSSFIYRLNRYADEGFFDGKDIDTVFVFGGTNDCWSGAPRGELKLEGWQEKDLFEVLPAIGYIIHRLKELLPKARIVWLINSDLGTEIPEAMKKACRHFDIEYIEFQNIDKHGDHPTTKGMVQIKEQILKSLPN